MKIFANFSLNLFCLLCGFFFGNLFGSLELHYFESHQHTTSEFESYSGGSSKAKQIISFFPGPGILGFLLLFIAEILNWWEAREKTNFRQRTGFFPRSKTLHNFSSTNSQNQILGEVGKKSSVWLNFMNSFKTGFLFGIFVDAFKVGS